MPKLIDLLKFHGAQIYNKSRLLKLGKREWWENNESLALAYSLRKSCSFDWDAYIEAYPDVKYSQIDPILHYTRHGIYEGRELFLSNAFSSVGAGSSQVSLSIILYNYNGLFHLPHVIQSLKCQGLDNIEVIIIDDASTDGSDKYLIEISKSQIFFKIIISKSHIGAHLARKAAISRANGKYVMFMDCNDYLLPDCCRKLLSLACDDVDIINFNAAIKPVGAIANAQMSYITKQVFVAQGDVYYGCEIINEIFINNKVPKILNNKLIKIDICKTAFNDIQGALFSSSYNEVELLAICARASSLVCLHEALYIHRPCHIRQEPVDMAATPVVIEPCIRTYEEMLRLASQLALDIDQDGLSETFLSSCLNVLLARKVNSVRDNFDACAKSFGILTLLNYFIDHHSHELEKIAAFFENYGIGRPHGGQPRKIGLLFSNLGNGGAERVVIDQVTGLLNLGYEVTVFLATSHHDDGKIPQGAKIRYYGGHIVKSQLGVLCSLLKKDPVDVMICHEASWDESMLWKTMLFKYLGIDVIGYLHSSFYRRLLHPGSKYDLQTQAAVLRCTDKLLSLSIYGEIYWRNRGANAQYIPNPVRARPSEISLNEKRENILLVFGRLSEPNKRRGDCLLALSEIVKELPEARMIFIGSFINHASSDDFYNQVKDLGLSRHIHVTGWLDKPDPFLAKAKLLVSTAMAESFSLTMAEAQYAGLPCVMYELPLMIARRNPSVLQAEQGDYHTLARLCIAILKNDDLWLELSQMARIYARRYSVKTHTAILNKILKNYRKNSTLRSNRPSDYVTVLKTLASYASLPPPWLLNK